MRREGLSDFALGYGSDPSLMYFFDDTDARWGVASLGRAPGPLLGLRLQRLIMRTYVMLC